jgi:hypothetical protein
MKQIFGMLQPDLLFLVRFVAAWSRFFSPSLSSGQLLLHEPQALILLAEAYQFIFDDCFNLIF